MAPAGNKAADGASTAREVYEVTGDASAALQLVSIDDSPTEAYNRCVLQAMLHGNIDTGIWRDLQRLETPILQQPTTAARKRRCEEWILAYNRGLLLLARGQATLAMATVWKALQFVFSDNTSTTKKIPQDLLPIACRMALLMLEGVLTLSVGSPMGIPNEWCWKDPTGTGDESSMLLSTFVLDKFLLWTSKSVDEVTTSDQHQLKFTLSLYMARMDFLQREEGKMVDARVRSARKELKQAMEIFQHKLKSADAASTASESAISEGAGGIISLPGTISSYSNTEAPLPRFLQRHNQAALNLKANTEQLKGNIKKSLILCGEAQAANVTTNYDAMHYNNLAIVYATHGKAHLALHSWSKAISTNTKSFLESDGTVSLDVTCKILYNAAMGSLKARNFLAAYECLGTCLQNSDIWRQRAKAWLRLGEACLGLWSMQQKQGIESMQGNSSSGGGGGSCGFASIEIGGEAKGVLLGASAGDPKDIGQLASVLASPADLQQLQVNPLPRARACYECALDILKISGQESKDQMVLMSAQLSMAYIGLETQDFALSLEFAKAVLKHELPETGTDSARKAMFQRQQATARMYASETSCILGDAISSMKYLVGDGKNDAFDRLASALAGVTIETAASHSGNQGKMRLAKAQAMVRCSASAASAGMGNLTAAKQLAMSAQAMSREGSYATRALVYCMLREGNRGAALTLLRSAR